MIASTKVTNAEIFACIVVLVFELLSSKFFVYKHKRQEKLLKSKQLFKKITYFTVKLLQNYK